MVHWSTCWKFSEYHVSEWHGEQRDRQMKIYRKLSDILFFLTTLEMFCVVTVWGLAYKVDSVFDKVKQAWQRCSHVKAGFRRWGGEAAGRKGRAIFVRRAAISLSGGWVWSDCEQTIDEARGDRRLRLWREGDGVWSSSPAESALHAATFAAVLSQHRSPPLRLPTRRFFPAGVSSLRNIRSFVYLLNGRPDWKMTPVAVAGWFVLSFRRTASANGLKIN